MKVRIKFRKYGVMKFIGHLDIMRYFQKAMSRAKIPIAYTGGYSPHMVMSFANPLGVGLTSDGEYFDIELLEYISSVDAISKLNEVMVEGMDIVSVVQLPDSEKTGMSIVAAASYLSSVAKGALTENWKEQVLPFLSQDQIRIVKKTKKSELEVDIKPMIYKFQCCGDKLYMFIATGSAENLKPGLVTDAFLQYIGLKKEEIIFSHHRTELYADKADSGASSFVKLEDLGSVME